MKMLLYRCPFCDQYVEVASDQAGQRMECPNSDCGRSFRLDLPTAQVLTEEDGSRGGTESERTLLRVHPAMFRKHPFQFALYWLLVAGGLLAAGWWWSTTGDTLGTAAAVGVAALALVLLGTWWLQVLCTTLTVTTKRTIHRTGILSRRTTEVRHNDVRNLQLEQSVIERIFGVGDIAISSAGQAGLEIVADGIPHPDETIRTIRERQQ